MIHQSKAIAQHLAEVQIVLPVAEPAGPRELQPRVLAPLACLTDAVHLPRLSRSSGPSGRSAIASGPRSSRAGA